VTPKTLTVITNGKSDRIKSTKAEQTNIRLMTGGDIGRSGDGTGVDSDSIDLMMSLQN
jgi:hypothetical protein